MAAEKDIRTVILNLFCLLPLIFAQHNGYTIPEVQIHALKPRGVSIFMATDSEMYMFIFRGNINEPIDGWGSATILTVVTIRPKMRYVTELMDNVKLDVGDVINYIVYIRLLRDEYANTAVLYTDKRSYTVTELFYSGINESSVTSTLPPTTPTSTLPPMTRTSTLPSIWLTSTLPSIWLTSTLPPTTLTSTLPPTTLTSTLPSITQPTYQLSTSTSVPPPACTSTVTTVLGRDTSACSGDVIFEDNFDTLREDVWKIEQYIPTKPEYPFVSYQRLPDAPTVSVQEGMLRIEPKLQQALPGFNADFTTMNDYVLDLTSGCTQPICSYTNAGAQIMPPIASGRLTSSTFSFKYGVIEVRAKLPQGDWLYPDIILEPQAKKYGFENYASGILRIAGARGNMVLTKGLEEYGNKVLYGGPIMDFKCREYLLSKKTSDSAWGDDFHVYSLRWAPDKITLYVDGEEYGRVEPTASGLHNRLPKYFCNPPRTFFKTPLAPFDDFFQITLGVSAGGISEFPEQATGPNLEPKPWKNNAHHAKLRFYDDLSSWYPWSQPTLLVDYVKVRAL